ncbi:hypothetical protein YYC_04334 [Plasmodium yoelii 17X]|uniref:Transcription factor CBF/NF-Y/archaeal histone domain-containing protein n=1 Tax=Plasmodium yoelii 17X TaxID=1323249 RepID=V7PCZ3_PLAYE|nr:hypothetical protein YYC_04334 [Plasmodium yoelii 17X]
MLNSINSDKPESGDKTDMENNVNDREVNDNNITNNKLNNNENFDNVSKNGFINDKINVEKTNSDSSNNDISIKRISENENDQGGGENDKCGSEHDKCGDYNLRNKDIQHILDNSLECDNIVIKNVEDSNNKDIEKSEILENNQIQKNITHYTNNNNDNNKFCKGEDAIEIENINTSYKNIYSESIDDSHKDEFNYKEISCIKIDNSDFNKREQYDEKNGSISPIKMNNNSDKSDDLNNYNLENNELDKNADNFDEKKEKNNSKNCLNSSNDKNNCNNNNFECNNDNFEYNNGNDLNTVCTNASGILDINNKTNDSDIIMKNNDNAEIGVNKIKEMEEEKNKCSNNENDAMSNKENINEIKNGEDDNIVFNNNNSLQIFKEKENKIKENYEIASEDNAETDAKLYECKEVSEKETNEKNINNDNGDVDVDKVIDGEGSGNTQKEEKELNNCSFEENKKYEDGCEDGCEDGREDGCEKPNVENDNYDDINKKRKHISSCDESRKDRKLSSQKEHEEIENEDINKYGNDIDSNAINTTFCKNNNTNIIKYVNSVEEIISSNSINGDSKNNSNSSALNLKIENDEGNGANDTNGAYFSDMKISNAEENHNYNDLILKQENKDSLNKEEKNDINNIGNNCKDECSNKSQDSNIEKNDGINDGINDGKNDSEHNLENLKDCDEKSRDNDDEYEDEQNENMSDNNYSDDEKTNLDNCNTNDKKKNKNDSETLLPIANISRIMKRILPAKAKVAKESKDIIREYVTEFIQFLTSEASDRCLNEKRKTINGEDILFSMEKLGFNDYVEPLSEYLNKWKQMKGLSTSNRYYDKKFDISRNSQEQNMLINYNTNIFNNMNNNNYYAKENYGYNEGNCTANHFFRNEKNEFCNNNFSNSYFNNNGKNNINRT